MAFTEKLPSGRWRGGYRDSAHVKRWLTGTYYRKSDARDDAQEEEVKARRQVAAVKGKLSARTAWGDWWDIVAPERDFPSDTPKVEAFVVGKYLRPEWGDVALNQIAQRDIQAWVDRLCRDGHSPAYVKRIYAVFRVSIATAVRRGILTASPCVAVKLPAVPKRPKRYISTDILPVLVTELEQPWADAVELIMETGMRPGELAGLHARNADLATGWLTIATVYVYRRNIMRPWPKDAETREVPLSARAIEIIRGQLGERAGGCGVPHVPKERCAHPLVFLAPGGAALSPEKLWYQLREAAKRLELDHTTPYAARRGYATRLADAGVDAFALADLMGHADVAETRGYVQRTPAARAKVLGALGERQPLRPVVGQRGTARGTDLGTMQSQPAPSKGRRQAP